MKYNIKAFSLTEINQTEEILVWCKGPICYRAFGGKLRFIFPWNVKKIVFKNIQSFPVSFWGIRGSQKLSVEHISNKVLRWNSCLSWSCITSQSKLDDFDDTYIKSQLNEIVKSEIKQIDKIVKKTEVKYYTHHIIDLSNQIIPDTILTTKK